MRVCLGLDGEVGGPLCRLDLRRQLSHRFWSPPPHPLHRSCRSWLGWRRQKRWDRRRQLRLNLLGVLCGTNWGSDREILSSIYKPMWSPFYNMEPQPFVVPNQRHLPVWMLSIQSPKNNSRNLYFHPYGQHPGGTGSYAIKPSQN